MISLNIIGKEKIALGEGVLIFAVCIKFSFGDNNELSIFYDIKKLEPN